MARNTITTSISFSPDTSVIVDKEMTARQKAQLGPRACSRAQVVNDIIRVGFGRTPCVPLMSAKKARKA